MHITALRADSCSYLQLIKLSMLEGAHRIEVSILEGVHCIEVSILEGAHRIEVSILSACSYSAYHTY